MDRSIIHLNVADFAVAVERTIDCRLRHRPVIVAPRGAARAAVYDMSEEAYQCGVCKGMPLRKAERLCRDARILPPHPDRYERAMGALCKQAFQYSPFVEPGEGDGHLFVDVTGTSRLDQHVKFGAYEKAGVPEYWLVDPKSRTITVYHLSTQRREYDELGRFGRGSEHIAHLLQAPRLVSVFAEGRWRSVASVFHDLARGGRHRGGAGRQRGSHGRRGGRGALCRS